MAGKASRSRGKRGESEAREVLTERGYEVIDTIDGIGICDIIAERNGRRYHVEVKHCRNIELEKFEAQARRQSRGSWLVMARLPGYPYCFLVTSAHGVPTVWRGNAAKK